MDRSSLSHLMAGPLLRYIQSLLPWVSIALSRAHTATGPWVPLILHRAACCQSKVAFELLLLWTHQDAKTHSPQVKVGWYLFAQFCANDCKCVCMPHMYMCLNKCVHVCAHMSTHIYWWTDLCRCYAGPFKTQELRSVKIIKPLIKQNVFYIYTITPT